MHVLIVAVGFAFVGFGCFILLKAIIKTLRALARGVWLVLFASDGKLERIYEEEVIATPEEYRKHSDSVDRAVQDILNS